MFASDGEESWRFIHVEPAPLVVISSGRIYARGDVEVNIIMVSCVIHGGSKNCPVVVDAPLAQPAFQFRIEVVLDVRWRQLCQLRSSKSREQALRNALSVARQCALA